YCRHSHLVPHTRLNLSSLTEAATTDIYTLSLHDALPIWANGRNGEPVAPWNLRGAATNAKVNARSRASSPSRSSPPPSSSTAPRSEEHTSELQSRAQLVCRPLLGKKNASQTQNTTRACQR